MKLFKYLKTVYNLKKFVNQFIHFIFHSNMNSLLLYFYRLLHPLIYFYRDFGIQFNKFIYFNFILAELYD